MCSIPPPSQRGAGYSLCMFRLGRSIVVKPSDTFCVTLTSDHLQWRVNFFRLGVGETLYLLVSFIIERDLGFPKSSFLTTHWFYDTYLSPFSLFTDKNEAKMYNVTTSLFELTVVGTLSQRPQSSEANCLHVSCAYDHLSTKLREK